MWVERREPEKVMAPHSPSNFQKRTSWTDISLNVSGNTTVRLFPPEHITASPLKISRRQPQDSCLLAQQLDSWNQKNQGIQMTCQIFVTCYFHPMAPSPSRYLLGYFPLTLWNIPKIPATDTWAFSQHSEGSVSPDGSSAHSHLHANTAAEADSSWHALTSLASAQRYQAAKTARFPKRTLKTWSGITDIGVCFLKGRNFLKGTALSLSKTLCVGCSGFV